MVSEAVRDVIAIYGRKVSFKEVFLLDPERDEGHIYYIPFQPVVDWIGLREIETKIDTTNVTEDENYLGG